MKKLNVLGKMVPIDYLDLSMVDFDGAYVASEERIVIDTELKDNEKHAVILHEAVHALFDRLGLKGNLPESLEEILSETFALMVTENFKIKPKTSGNGSQGR